MATAEVEPCRRRAGFGARTAEREFAAGPLAQRVAVLLGVILIPARLIDNEGYRGGVSQQGIGPGGDVPQPGSRSPARRDLQALLALLLIRVTENTAGQPWSKIRAELQRQHAVTWTGPAGTFRQSTELTKPQRDIYTALSIEPPKKIISLAQAPPVP